jgi:L-arabinokinase
MLAAYVSGHGFGHATRVGEVLRVVRERAPDLPLAIVTAAPEALFRAAIPGPLTYRQLACDTGLVQNGALTIDEEGTIHAWRAFQSDQPARIARETEWLRQGDVRVVVGDIPPLAFEAAAVVGVTSVGLGNFSWDWIYRHFGKRHPYLNEAADAAAASYAKADLLLQLPFAGDLSAFRTRERLPLLARRPRLSREEVRRRLGFEGIVILWSFGGLGLPGFDPQVLTKLAPRQVVVSDPGDLPKNVRCIPNDELERQGLRYNDMLAGADVIVTKPGYGIVSDAIAAGVRMVYTDRGDFPEYPIMVAEMQQWLPAVFATNADVLTGHIAPAIDEVLAIPSKAPPDLTGAEKAADRLLSLLR